VTPAEFARLEIRRRVELALSAEAERIEAQLQALLDQGEIPVIVDRGVFLAREVISTHEYARRYGPPPLPRRRPATDQEE